MNEIDEKLEIDDFQKRKKTVLIISSIIYEVIFLLGIIGSIVLLKDGYSNAPMFLAASILHIVFWPYIVNRFLSMCLRLVHYGFLYRAKRQFLIYEILMVLAIEILLWCFSAMFIKASAALFYLALPFLCGFLIAIPLERYTLKELLLQVKDSRRQRIYDDNDE
ncbi:MAG: hypothetical protein VB015_04510 [Erysipelotrichaceae bacterium]|nr:hypothetical protein [Erysipelotrichaceae bacterium]